MARQPGIQCKNVILVDCEFRRVPDFPESDIKLNYNFTYTKKNRDCDAEAFLNLKLIAKNNQDEVVLQLGCSYVGIFSIDIENKNLEMDSFLEHNAPAIILPYIRHFVHNITAQAGIEPIILPPINILALVATSKKEKNVSDPP